MDPGVGPGCAYQNALESRGKFPLVLLAKLCDHFHGGVGVGDALLEPLPAVVKGGGSPCHFDDFLTEIKDEGAVEHGRRGERVGVRYSAEGRFLKVVGVPCVSPVVGQRWCPSRGVDPMDGTRDGSSGRDFM